MSRLVSPALILPPSRSRFSGIAAGPLVVLFLSLLLGCGQKVSSIKFAQVPPATKGGKDTHGFIAGTVDRLVPGQRVVLYARNGSSWWVQPLANAPFTTVHSDGTWSSSTHLGTSYAALLVDGDYQPLTRSPSLPKLGGHVLAIIDVSPPFIPSQTQAVAPKTLLFGGYEWETSTDSSRYGGKEHLYVNDNAWLDDRGALHLRVSRNGDNWVCGEVHTVRSLGYGTYQFGLRDIIHLQPSVTLGLFTWQKQLSEQAHREIDINISRWGNPRSPNAQFMIQPYYVPANIHRFEIPRGPITTSFKWTPGRAEFAAAKGSEKPFSVWTFTSGIPTTGGEKTYINLCEYGFGSAPLRRDTEVVIDRFQFLP
jgi:hypothetical protein